MNSTIKNKTIQIQILLKQQQAVKDHLQKQKLQGYLEGGTSHSTQIPVAFSRARFEQEQAVREILNNYGEQLNFRSVTEHRKRRQAAMIKDRYT
jgi:hypothetical protein